MNTINNQFVIRQFRSGLQSYISATKQIGLWKSERSLITTYVKLKDRILDLGCGTGRTTFALHDLGYTELTGIDLTPEMIQEARRIAKIKEISIPFIIGDACDLPFGESSCDCVFFSFNGLTTIPTSERRLLAIKEIFRVLTNGGLFIFTTYDRDGNKNYQDFWKNEKTKWENGTQDKRLHEYGDLITSSKNETGPIYIHIPDQHSISTALESTGFSIIDTFMRNERFEESDIVKNFSGECRFWIAQKREHS